MIKKNTTLTIEIESVTAKGFGVSRIKNKNMAFVLFTDGALPGDKLTVKVIKVKPRYGYGKILKILSPSPHRIDSPCPASGKCGGCQWQNCEYKAQLDFKKDIVTDALARIGGIADAPVADVIGMDVPQPYRNKAVFPVVPFGDSFEIGMYAPRSHRIIPITSCIIQHPAHVPMLAALRRHMMAHSIPAYDETTHKGIVRHIIIRTSLATGEIMVVLVVNANGIPMEDKLSDAFTSAGATTIVINPHRAKTNTIMGDKFRVVTGTGFIREQIGNISYQLSAPSFFQINPIQTEVLYNKAVEMAGLTGAETVIDAHVGIGGVALQAAHMAKEIIGVDIAQESIRDAERNAKINDIQNARFIHGAAEDIIPKMLDLGACKNIKPDIAFLDPPRKGCETPLLDALIAAKIKTVVYISCDPATLARDIKRLVAGGYTLQAVQPVDMFPMTGKIENIALLTQT